MCLLGITFPNYWDEIKEGMKCRRLLCFVVTETAAPSGLVFSSSDQRWLLPSTSGTLICYRGDRAALRSRPAKKPSYIYPFMKHIQRWTGRRVYWAFAHGNVGSFWARAESRQHPPFPEQQWEGPWPRSRTTPTPGPRFKMPGIQSNLEHTHLLNTPIYQRFKSETIAWLFS